MGKSVIKKDEWGGTLIEDEKDDWGGTVVADEEKKNPVGNGLSTGTTKISPSSSISQLPLNADQNDNSGASSFGQYDVFNNPLNLKEKPTLNVSGIPVKLNGDLPAPIPFVNGYNPHQAAKELQERIDTKTYLPEDIDVVANSMQVSKKAASSFLKGDIGTGQVIHYNDVKEKQQDQLKAMVDKANQDLGLSDNYESNLATPETAGAYISKITNLYNEKAKRESVSAVEGAAKANPVLFGEGTAVVDDNTSKQTLNAAQQIKNILTNDIIDKVSVDNTLTKDQKVKKIYQLSDGRDYKNVNEAIDKRLELIHYLGKMAFSNSFTDNGTSDDIDLLNANKAGIEYKVNQKVKEQLDYNAALKSSFIEEYNSKLADGSIKATDETAKKYFADRIQKIDTETALIKPQYSSDKEIFKKYPVLEKAAIANAVNEFNAVKSGNVEGYENGDEDQFASLKDHLAARGWDVNDQKVQDVLTGDNFKDYSFFGRPLKNALDVFTNTGKAVGDVLGIRDDADLLAEKKQAELFPTQVGDNDPLKLTTAAGVGQNVGNTTGQVIGQGLLQAGTAGLGRMAGLSKLAATNAAFWSSGSLTSYDQAYKDSYDFIDSDAGRTAYAGLIALSNAASEKIFPDIKLFQIPGIKDEISALAKKIGSKDFTQELADQLTEKTMAKVKNSIVAYAKHAGSDVAKETVEEVSTQLFEDALRFVAGDPNANLETAIENAKNTAIQTATGMLAIGAYGAHKSVQEERNTAPKATIYNAALYHDEAHDAIEEGYKQNLYSEDERNEKIKTLNTAVKANQTMLTTEKVSGKELKRPEKELYVANLTAEALLTEQMKNSDDVLLQKSLEEKISNLQSQRQEILDGKVDIDEDGNINVSQKSNQNEKGNTKETGNVNANDEAGAGSEIIRDQAEQNRQENVNSNTEADQKSASVNEKLQQIEDDRAAELKDVDDQVGKLSQVLDRDKIQSLIKSKDDINQYYDNIKNQTNATTINPEGQQQASNQQSSERKRSSVDAGQQSQTSKQETSAQSNSSDSNLSSEEEAAQVADKRAKELLAKNNPNEQSTGADNQSVQPNESGQAAQQQASAEGAVQPSANGEGQAGSVATAPVRPVRIRTGQNVNPIPERQPIPAKIKTEEDANQQKQNEVSASQSGQTASSSDNGKGAEKQTRQRTRGTRKANRAIRHPEQLKALTHEVSSPLDRVLQYFISGGKISPSAIEKVFGNKRGKTVNGETLAKVDLLDKTAPSLSEVAHKMWDNLSEEEQKKYDSLDFENAVESALTDFNSRTQMAKDLNERFNATNEDENNKEYVDWLNQAYDTTGDQSSVDDAIGIIENLSDEEVQRIIDEEKEGQDAYVNQLISEQDSEPLFSTKKEVDDFETNDSRPVSVDLLQTTYPDATIVQTQSDLPPDIQAQAEGKTVEGVLHNGKVYMIADNISNMGRAEGVYKHETIGHAGVIADLKDKLDGFASNLVNRATGGQRSAIDRLSNRLFKQASTKLNDEQKSTLGQEYIAQAAEKSEGFPTTWQKIVSFVRDFLRDRGIKLSVSENDIKVLLSRAAKQVNSNAEGTRFSQADDYYQQMQDRLKQAREESQLPDQMPEDLKNYADDIIDFLKTDNKDITADEVIADMAQDAGTQFSSAEAPGLYDYVRSQFDAEHQQAHQQQQKTAPEPAIAASVEDKSKLSDVDREVISKELEKKPSERDFPNQFDMNEQLKQIASKTQSSGQDRVALDGNYVQAHLEDLRQISLITAKSLETALGAKWKNKVVQFLEERPNAGNGAQVAGLMNVISTDIFNEIAKARSGNKISELQDLQARVDRLAYDNARTASLALNQRRLYQDFAQGKPVTDILSEVILTPEQQQLKQAAEEALKQKFSDKELNKKTPKPKTPKTATTKTTTPKVTPKTNSKTIKDDLVAKGKAIAQNDTLADKIQQAKDALDGFKC